MEHFGNRLLSYLVYKRTYSRNNEEWPDTLNRVLNGYQSIGLEEINDNKENIFNLMKNFKFLPAGRILWAMGTKILSKPSIGSLCLYNCSYISTKDIDRDGAFPFTYLMDLMMLGVGVGFDLKGKNKIKINKPSEQATTNFQIDDTREGWKMSLEKLLLSYFKPNQKTIIFNYTKIRKKGQELKTFGGLSSGSGPLIYLHDAIRKLLNKEIDYLISGKTICDIMNLIASCVIAGNVRRSAEICGDEYCAEFLDLKDYKKNPEREEWGWASNNTVIVNKYLNENQRNQISEKIKINGEPGLFFKEKTQNYGRLCDSPDYKEKDEIFTNPCGEITLESGELCNLVEVFISNHSSYEEFEKTLYYAYICAKSITFFDVPYCLTNEIIKRNRRIGISLTGIPDFLENNELSILKEWTTKGYKYLKKIDVEFSKKYNIPESIKLTCIKPSGTLSLLAGVCSGVHYPISEYYIRRVRINKCDNLIDLVRELNFPFSDCEIGTENYVVEIPIKSNCKRSDISMFEQLLLTEFMQKYWADNSVSSTITFNKEEAKELPNIINYYQHSLKCISFLPKLENCYPQMPYEKITKEKYEKLKKKQPRGLYNKRKFDVFNENNMMYCDNEKCALI